MRGSITLVNDNHMVNYLKKILAFVYYGSTVNHRLNKRTSLQNMNAKVVYAILVWFW